MGEIFGAIFGHNVILATILTAMLPLVELKGAIPLGSSVDIWGEFALSTWSAFAWALLGSCLVVPVVALLFRPIYNWLKDKKFFKTILDFIVGDVAKRSNQINADAQNQTARRTLWLKILAIFLFVAFPVPGTGVWTGTCFAILLGLNFWVACGVVIAGNTVCGLIMTVLCAAFPQLTTIFLVVFLLLIVVFLAVKLVLHIVKKRRSTVGTTDSAA